ncbi:putative DNA-binding transcriptional regulator YafY [Streptacidiphilus sp. MAP12-33]|uniref:WYL domain-containing protein n=1 Tax=Streptacidiphilus sp. MAP12-33 TaxID=3156266 RepID=UPI00351755A4
MFRTSRETSEQTLNRLIRAWDRRRAVTLTYTKADGSETVRTIEITDVTTSKAGDVLIKAMDRASGELRTWRLDRIDAYTVHTTGYVVPVAAVAPRPAGHGLAAATARVAALTPATVTPAARTQLLTDLLAA